MALTIEERLSVLEMFRYATLGRINALQHMLLDAWLNLLRKSTDDLVPAAEELREKWLENAKKSRPFPGVEPVHLDLVAQEYEEALDNLTQEFVRLTKAARPKADGR